MARALVCAVLWTMALFADGLILAPPQPCVQGVRSLLCGVTDGPGARQAALHVAASART
jgi:hypothetical protein